jgi:hypothetical protein
MRPQGFARSLALARPIVKVMPTESISNRARDIHSMIAKRAYRIFLERGEEHCHDLEDGLKAEVELLCNIPVGLMDSGGFITAHLGLMGDGVHDLEVATRWPCTLLQCNSRP